jgi:hypothetical protein
MSALPEPLNRHGLYIICFASLLVGGGCSTNGEKGKPYRLLVEKLEEKRPQEDKDVGGWVILRWMLER